MGYLDTVLKTALGTLDYKEGLYTSWSPNWVKSIDLQSEYISVSRWGGGGSVIPIVVEDCAPITAGVFQEYVLGNLNEITGDVSMLSPDALAVLETEYPGKSRLHAIGGREIATDSQDIIKKETEHFPVDAKLDKIIGDELRKQNGYWEDAGAAEDEVQEGSSEGQSEEGQSEEDEDFLNQLRGVATPMVKGYLNSLLAQLVKMYAASEVIKPYGIISKDSRGRGIVIRKVGDKVEQIPYSSLAQESMIILEKYASYTIEETVNINEIAEKTLESATGEGLYFANKHLEFAFGWSDSKIESLKESLSQLYMEVAKYAVQDVGLEDDVSSPESKKAISKALGKLNNAMGTAILISKNDIINDMPVSAKIRMIDPRRPLPSGFNLSQKAIEVDIAGIEGAPDPVGSVVQDGNFYESYFETDHSLANASPLFAYKMLPSLKARGITPNMDNLIFGLAEDGTILTASEDGINLRSKLVHWDIAGSRAGKGVWTQNIKASAIGSNRPIFYLDDAPDVGSLVLSIYEDAFMVNGALIQQTESRDYFRKLSNADSMVNWDHIPDFVPITRTPHTYEAYGNYFYMRAMLLVLGIIAARVTNPEELGGEEGIVVVFDEFYNVYNTFMRGEFLKIMSMLHPTGSYKTQEDFDRELQEWEDAGKPAGKKPSKSDVRDDLDKGSAWSTDFYLNLMESFRNLTTLSAMGLQDTEAKRSDIFVLTQHITEMYNSVDDVLPLPNKGQKGVAQSRMKGDFLASMINTLGSSDVFLGYNVTDKKDILGQKSGSKAADKLDAKARNFAYLPEYSPDRIVGPASHKEAERAIYFKPFLIFADGKEDSYFVTNAKENIEKAGISWESVVAQNEDPARKGHLDPRVGFEAYLNDMGLSHDPSESFKKAADIANTAVRKMGYPGTWKEFVFDLRPEWVFSVSDVANAVKGVGMRPYDVRLPESLRFDSSLKEKEASNTAGLANTSNTRPIRKPAFNIQEEGFSAEENIASDVGIASTENFTPSRAGSWTEDEDAVSTEEFAPSNAGSWSEEDLNPDNWASDNTEEMSPLDQTAQMPVQEGAPVRRSVFNNVQPSFGAGEYVNADGQQAQFINEAAQPLNVGFPSNNMDNNLGNLMTVLTQSLIEYCGGVSRIRSISVVGGTIIINNRNVKYNLPEGYLSALPMGDVSLLQAGQYAEFFDWSALVQMPNLGSMSFDSVDFVMNYVSPGLGWGTYASVDKFFRNIRPLQRFTIGGEVFTRSNYKEKLASDNTFYMPTKVRYYQDLWDARAVSWLSKSTSFFSKSWRTDQKRGVLQRLGIGFLGAVGVAGSLAAASGTKAFKTSGSMWEALKTQLYGNEKY